MFNNAQVTLNANMASFASSFWAVVPSKVNMGVLIALIIVLQFTLCVYRAYFDSLSGYPGPKLWAATVIPESYYKFKGILDFELAKLHEKYGPVIRTTPNSLSYSTGDAWREIFAGKPQLMKNPLGGPPPGSNGVNAFIFEPSDELHARYRRNFKPGFSDKALRDQKPIIKNYVDLLMKKLQGSKSPVNMNDYFQFVMLDIIGDLTFGEPFDCLHKSSMDGWVRNIFAFVKAFWLITAVRKFEPLGTIFFLMAAHMKAFTNIKVAHQKVVFEKLDRRIAMGVEMSDSRQDFMTHVLKNKGTKDGMTGEEIDENAEMFVIAGAETTGSLLSGTLYYASRDKSVLDRLVEEIRNSFLNEDGIDMNNLAQLPYLGAVTSEVLRIFPPVPQGVQRVTAPEGNMIAGRFVPGKTLVGINRSDEYKLYCDWASYHTAANFKDPYIFDPERWLGNARYQNDRRESFKPFSYGPRNCIGQALALAEAKFIISKLLWNFDVELCDESKNWAAEARPYGVWEKTALLVNLKPIVKN